LKEKLGFFGGCFNPVTNAHINLIKEVIKKENLSKVYFVPMGDLYEKKDLVSLEDRIKMLELAFQNEDNMEILNISNTNKKTSAIDTFKIIDETFADSDRYFIMGSDNYKNILNWESANELVNNYNYIILDRENGVGKNISSTLVREKIQNGEKFSDLVPNKICDYIEQKKLYNK
jgi:nicotinate-nucleotide adenylyltransferase